MADTTTVNGQITDAATQANAQIASSGSAHALASLMQAMSHAAGLAMHNAVAAQQNMAILHQAVTAKCVTHILNAGASNRDDDLLAEVAALLNTTADLTSSPIGEANEYE